MTGTFSYFQEMKSQAIMEGFKSFLPDTVNVIRNGVLTEVLAKDIVPGDIIEFTTGGKVPADIRVVDCSKDVQVDNSGLTGESEPQVRAVHCTDDN
eukprot:61842_1